MIPLYLDPDAPTAIHGLTAAELDGRSPIRNPITFASTPSIILNDPTDDGNDTYHVETVSISPAWDSVVEPHADKDGSLIGPPREMQKIIELRGWVRAPSLAALNDKIAALNRAFNPVNNYLSDIVVTRNNIGAIPIKFAVPTKDTVTWPLGYILQQYYVRSESLPVPVTSKYDDFQARFHIVLRAADPRRYEQSIQSANRTGSGSIVVDNSKSTYDSWPTIEIVFITGVASDIDISRTTLPNVHGSIKLERDGLTDSAGKTLILDTQFQDVYYLQGLDVKHEALRNDSVMFNLLGGVSNTITLSVAMPSDAVTTIKWRRAFA